MKKVFCCMDDPRAELAKYRIEKAKEELSAAKLLLEKGIVKSSLSSSYYSIFHSARALLSFEKLDNKKHSGVITLFINNFVKKSLLSEKMKSILTKAFEIRNESDYKDFYTAAREEASEQIANAEYFINEIISFIRKNYEVKL